MTPPSAGSTTPSVSPPVVGLKHSSRLFLMGSIPTDPPVACQVRGHLAALLGACIISSPEEGGGESSTSDSLPRVASEPCMSAHSLTCLPSPPGRELLISMVTRRLGLGPYEEAWEGMVASGPFAQADQLWRASDADARAHAACPFPPIHSDPSHVGTF